MFLILWLNAWETAVDSDNLLTFSHVNYLDKFIFFNELTLIGMNKISNGLSGTDQIEKSIMWNIV